MHFPDVYAPSDICGITGMRHEHIRATPSWRKGCAHYDTILVNSNPEVAGVHGFEVAYIFLFFYFGTMTKIIPVPWFSGIHMCTVAPLGWEIHTLFHPLMKHILYLYGGYPISSTYETYIVPLWWEIIP